MKKITFSILAITLASGCFAQSNLKACLGCHGQTFEKKALNKSKIVKDMSKKDILVALKGYKEGTYGGATKGLMKGQLKKYEDLETLADDIVATSK